MERELCSWCQKPPVPHLDSLHLPPDRAQTLAAHHVQLGARMLGSSGSLLRSCLVSSSSPGLAEGMLFPLWGVFNEMMCQRQVPAIMPFQIPACQRKNYLRNLKIYIRWEISAAVLDLLGCGDFFCEITCLFLYVNHLSTPGFNTTPALLWHNSF